MKTPNVLIALLVSLPMLAADLPEGYWPVSKSQPILDKARTIVLSPDLSGLTTGERAAVDALLEAGFVLQRLYEDARHPEALAAATALEELHAQTGSGKATQNLLDLYRLNQGPIAVTLENRREAFLPVSPQAATRNVYPAGARKEEINAFLEKHPEQRNEILGERTVVRRTTKENIERDLASLKKYPALDTLHPGLAAHLESVRGKAAEFPFYAVPQSVNWPDETMKVHGLLNRAADAVEGDDAEFARYLRNRSSCIALCPYTAISFEAEPKKARINEALCKGCGTCVAACPSGAIHQNLFEENRSSARSTNCWHGPECSAGGPACLDRGREF